MYFPYLRGKQFELIALREQSELLGLNKLKVSPVLEPVKQSSTLTNTLKELIAKDVNINFVINPSKGDMSGSLKPLELLQNVFKDYKNYQTAVIIKSYDNAKKVINAINKSKFKHQGFTLIHIDKLDEIDEIYEGFSSIAPIKYNLINLDNSNRRYTRRFEASTIVGLADYFKAQSKNAAYLNVMESDFSEEHLFYKDEGNAGFGDYLTIGDNYSESGFLPYAVAIHLSYGNKKKFIKIKHFVSDSNDDTSDIGGKFEEALTKLVVWCKANEIKTDAVKEFYRLDSSKHFPGLGTIKKLSLQNHIEVVLNLI